jgi:HSP20 family protein
MLTKKMNYSLLDELFDTSWNPIGYFKTTLGYQASTAEDSKNYYIEAIVPGFSEDEVKISVQGDRLTLTGKKEVMSESSQLYSATFTSFEKSYMLPKDVLSEELTAEYKSGILTLTIPKIKNKKPDLKEIKIKSLNK